MVDWAITLPWDLITKNADLRSLNPLLVGAIVMTESGGDPNALRYEPGWRYCFNVRTFANNQKITEESERVCQSISWGLIQIMGTVARELGLHDQCLTVLTDPDINLRYGCLKLKNLMIQYETETEVISAYNQGSARKTSGGLYKNQRYVDKVCRYLDELRKLK